MVLTRNAVSNGLHPMLLPDDRYIFRPLPDAREAVSKADQGAIVMRSCVMVSLLPPHEGCIRCNVGDARTSPASRTPARVEITLCQPVTGLQLIVRLLELGLPAAVPKCWTTRMLQTQWIS